MPDPLELCTNANFIAEALDETAGYKRLIREHEIELIGIGRNAWSDRLRRWAEGDEAAVRTIRALVTEVERLRKFER